MIQKEFADKVVEIVKKNPDVIGLAVAGSWITDELDEYSDLDLVLITKNKISDDREKMMKYAKSFGNFISGFTGEHVGEPRLLICLYDDPLLHVDIKFLTLPEFHDRIENPIVLFERDDQLTDIIKFTKAEWPQPDFQWIEDRMWTWVHYIASKAARGEYFECMDGLGFIRARVLAPLMQKKNKMPVRGLRKAEKTLKLPDLEDLKITVPQYNKTSILKALDNTISIYKMLRRKLFTDKVKLQELAEKRAMVYFKKVKS
ncbi:MAG: nucleotidyltransferase domain-containing protein [Chitinophagaceae bacterium]|nr:nucleotidyltransferase domain-containing protein [Chitinophagaceae bacterium]